MDNQNKDKKKNDELEKCFVIMPISDKEGYEPGHFNKVYEQIFRPAIKEAGYEPYRVDEEALSSIIQKIFNGLTKFPMAICDLSSGNPNVLYELGIRHSYDLPVVLVKDDKTNFIFDVSGINTIEYSSERLFENVMMAREKIQKAIEDTKIASKDGTLLRYISVSEAIYSNDDIKSVDKQELMFKEILNRINDLNMESHKDMVLRDSYVNIISKKNLHNSYKDKLNIIFDFLTDELQRYPTFDEFWTNSGDCSLSETKKFYHLKMKELEDKNES